MCQQSAGSIFIAMWWVTLSLTKLKSMKRSFNLSLSIIFWSSKIGVNDFGAALMDCSAGMLPVHNVPYNSPHESNFHANLPSCEVRVAVQFVKTPPWSNYRRDSLWCLLWCRLLFVAMVQSGHELGLLLASSECTISLVCLLRSVGLVKLELRFFSDVGAM